jgi:hypothetical protein
MARRAWAGAADVLNTLPLRQLRKALAGRSGAAGAHRS